jgi:ryanodine receptor 2
MPEYEVVDFARVQLTLPGKLDPADEMSWQHYLYSKLGKKELPIEEAEKSEKSDKKPEDKIENTVERIVAMAKVLFGLHMVSVLWTTDSLITKHSSIFFQLFPDI